MGRGVAGGLVRSLPGSNLQFLTPCHPAPLVLPSCRLAVYYLVRIAFGVVVRSVSYADQVPTGGIARERARDVA